MFMMMNYHYKVNNMNNSFFLHEICTIFIHVICWKEIGYVLRTKKQFWKHYTCIYHIIQWNESINWHTHVCKSLSVYARVQIYQSSTPTHFIIYTIVWFLWSIVTWHLFKVHLLHDLFFIFVPAEESCLTQLSRFAPLPVLSHSWCVSVNAVFTMYVVLE